MIKELIQRTFNNENVPEVLSASENHMACLFLLDTSGSMAGIPIEELNAGMNKFKEEVCRDNQTKEILDVAIVAFNSEERIVQNFTPIPYMEPVAMEAGGGTKMSSAIETAIDMVNERSKFYIHGTGTTPYKPWIIMISDGQPQDDITQTAAKVRGLEEMGKLKFFSLGVGEYDSDTLHELSGPKVMKLKGYDFTEFFDWIHMSMRAVSLSAPGDVPTGIPLPESVDKDTNDWMV